MVSREYQTANRDVVVRSLDGFATVAVVGNEHALVFDEPEEFQGGNIGPNPFGAILAAYGT